MHVVDISHPGSEEQIEAVNKTLQEVCGSAAKPVISGFCTKIDAFSYTPKAPPDDLTPSTRENISLTNSDDWMARMENNLRVYFYKKEQTSMFGKDLLSGKRKIPPEIPLQMTFSKI